MPQETTMLDRLTLLVFVALMTLAFAHVITKAIEKAAHAMLMGVV